MDQNLNDTKRLFVKLKVSEPSRIILKKTVASPKREKDATRSEHIKEQPSHPVVKVEEEEQEKDSKSTEVEKSEGESSMDRNLNDTKRLFVKLKVSEPSRIIIKKTVVAPERKKDARRTEHIKE
ncbi:hypothetical protein AVEN_187202-1 [Araneus ventricosus]|uniref:Uncharacterized protein n=1 Tax=Araneus ventricosus TaxID=182803 RepID=A0A4Y2WAP7_ARAVE|nr:hypothetical protein AVEN_187202-1 [Araneus ventricosus]